MREDRQGKEGKNDRFCSYTQTAAIQLIMEYHIYTEYYIGKYSKGSSLCYAYCTLSMSCAEEEEEVILLCISALSNRPSLNFIVIIIIVTIISEFRKEKRLLISLPESIRSA